MQTARNLGDEAYTQLRFQLSQSDYWVETQGRIAWTSASKQTAGVEFIGLSSDSLMFIKDWISSNACQHASEEENMLPGTVAPPKSAFILDETADVTSIPETAKTDAFVEEFIQALITDDLAAMLHPVAPKDAGGGPGNAIGENECRSAGENVITNGLELTLYPQSVRPEGPLTTKDQRGVTSKPSRYIGLLVGVALLLLVLISLGYYLRKAANGQPEEKALSEKLSLAPFNSSTSSVIAPPKPRVPSDAGFILQVAAVDEEKRAIAFADLLRQRGFPSYVFKPAASKLYRVLVGPYADADSAVKVENELRKQGFDAIRRKTTLAQ